MIRPAPGGFFRPTFIILQMADEEIQPIGDEIEDDYSDLIDDEDSLGEGSPDDEEELEEEPKQILLIGDDEQSVKYLILWLKDEYEVTTCMTPDEGLELALTGEYPLIISDITNPDKALEGGGAMETIGNARIKCLGIILTPKADPHFVLNVMSSKVVHRYLVKPIKKQSLLYTIEKAYDTLENDGLRIEKRQYDIEKLKDSRKRDDD